MMRNCGMILSIILWTSQVFNKLIVTQNLSIFHSLRVVSENRNEEKLPIPCTLSRGEGYELPAAIYQGVLCMWFSNISFTWQNACLHLRKIPWCSQKLVYVIFKRTWLRFNSNTFSERICITYRNVAIGIIYGIFFFLIHLEFITGLLQNIGTHVDPIKLIQVRHMYNSNCCDNKSDLWLFLGSSGEKRRRRD